MCSERGKKRGKAPSPRGKSRARATLEGPPREPLGSCPGKAKPTATDTVWEDNKSAQVKGAGKMVT